MRKTLVGIASVAIVGSGVLLFRASIVRALGGYWNNLTVVSFWAAWIPFAISLLLAFIPDQKMKLKARIWWRSLVICCGFFYSVLLWHQQSLTAQSSFQDQQKILGEAVAQSNEHSDKELAKVQHEVTGVRTDLQDATKKLGEVVSQSESDLNRSIRKVGKPDPPEPVKLVASLWRDNLPLDSFPLREESVVPNADGTIPVEWTFRNISESSAASNADIWITVCDSCSFAVEPPGYDCPAGTNVRTRHRIIQLLNPRIIMAKDTIVVKVDQPAPMFAIGFRYSCQLCSKGSTEIQQLLVTNPYGANFGAVPETMNALKKPQ